MLEILIAVSIVTISVLAATAVTSKAVYLSRQSFHESQAAFLLEEGAEGTRIVRDTGWSNISSLSLATNYYLVFSGGTWTLSTSSSNSSNPIGIFTRTIVISSVNRDSTTQNIVSSGGVLDSGTKFITVTVSWKEGGSTLTKALSFYLTNIFS